jgi:ectoine hydroxylase-related dioxygenase (phytanoyl-CoA dioxygenase family)
MLEQPPSTPEPDSGSEGHQWTCRAREEEFAGRASFIDRLLANTASADGGDLALRRMLSAVRHIIGDVHREGYCVIPELLGQDCLERLREGLEPLLAQSVTTFEDLSAAGPRTAFHIHNVLAKSRAADEVALHPMIRTVIGATLGFDYIFHGGAIVTAHPPGCVAQQVHRDDASYYALPRPRMPLVITVAVALDDFTVENGATRLAPGSCWWERGREPSGTELMPITMPAGSVMLWDGAVFHGGGANVSRDRARRTLFLNYTRGWLRTQVNQFLAVPRSVILSLPSELQKDLGYARSLRALGECDGHEPMDYLQAIVQRGDGAQAQLGLESTAGR